VLAASGEDAIAFSTESDYAANIEMAECIVTGNRPVPGAAMSEVATPDRRSIEEVCTFLNIASKRTVKTLIVESTADQHGKTALIALVLRGDHSLNEIKAEKIAGVSTPLRMADEARIKAELGAEVGSIGPVSLGIRVLVDRSASQLSDFVCGANRDGLHLQNVNWGRDLPEGEVVDLRNIEEGDPSPCGKGEIEIRRGIEVGHIFKLGNKYSAAMNARVLDQHGKASIMEMGCYGIGVSRVVAAAIEQNHDDRGIIWPAAIAPFELVIVTLNAHKSPEVASKAEALYRELRDQGIDVFLDDRNERPGVKFADLELVGIPHRLVVSERGLQNGTLEYKGRRDSENQDIAIAQVTSFILRTLGR
jgi:prolyl-tRNA synthetase